MDSKDQVQNVSEDGDDAPKVVDVQPKEQTAASHNYTEKKDTTSPGNSSEGSSETEGKQINNQTEKVESATTSDSTNQASCDPIAPIVRGESAQDSKPQEESDVKTKPKVEEDTTPDTSTEDTADQAFNDKDSIPQSDNFENATVRDSEPKQDESIEVPDSSKQDSDDVEPKERKDAGDSEDVPPKDADSADIFKEEDHTTPGSQLQDVMTPTKEAEDQKETPCAKENDVPPKDSEITDSLPEKEKCNIITPDEQNEPPTEATAISDNQMADSVGNNVKMESNAVIPSTEINGSTLLPDESKDSSAVTIDDDAIPSKTIDSEESPSSKRNYWEDNLLLVLAIILIILTVIATIILAVILVPILSRKVTWPMRLPADVIPQHYILEMRPHLVPDHFGFDGSVVITIICVNATRHLILHSAGLEIDEDSLAVINLEGGHSPFLLKADYDSENEIVIFYLCEDLTVGTKYDVHIKFKGKFAENSPGFAKVTYEKGGEQKHMALTKFESIYARKAFPCFDEPAMKATFDINLVRWRNMTSLSNMKRLAVVERDEHWEIDLYQTSFPMSTYLVTFVVGELEVIQKGKVSLWAAKDVDHYQFALNVSHRLLEFYEEYLEVPYGMPKLDQLAAERYSAAGMENWGVIIYQKNTIKSGVSEDNEIARMISHELAHQWFGNLVTMKWWDHLWLNEGFAAYFGFLGAAVINEGWKMEQEVIEYSSFSMECEIEDAPHYTIVTNFETTEDVKGYLRGVVYFKGTAIVRMMHLMLGDEVFRRALKRYLSENAFSNVDQDELWRQMTKAQLSGHPLDMKKIMEPWTKQPYYPLVTVKRNYRKNEATVEQISCINTFGNESNDMWPIPITWMDGTRAGYRDNTKIKLIFDSKKATLRGLPGKETWILVNVEHLGYYRVNYDELNWELLLWQLRHNYTVIPNLNRRQLILDAPFFANINQLSHAVALDILTYYPFEKDEIVLKALSHTRPIYCYGNMIKYTFVEKYWREFIHYLLKPIFIRYGRIWEEKVVTFRNKHFSWQQVGVLCYEKYAPCLSEARKRFEDLLRGNYSSDKPILFVFEGILCGLARNATTEEWNNMNQAYKNFHAQNFFLACTEDDLLFQRWFKEYLVSAEIIRILPIRLSEERWKYIMDVLRDVWNTIRKERMEMIMKNLAYQPHSKETLKMVAAFYESHKKDFSNESRQRIERTLSLCARKIPLPDAIINVGAWLQSRSWKKITIREIE